MCPYTLTLPVLYNMSHSIISDTSIVILTFLKYLYHYIWPNFCSIIWTRNQKRNLKYSFLIVSYAVPLLCLWCPATVYLHKKILYYFWQNYWFLNCTTIHGKLETYGVMQSQAIVNVNYINTNSEWLKLKVERNQVSDLWQNNRNTVAYSFFNLLIYHMHAWEALCRALRGARKWI